MDRRQFIAVVTGAAALLGTARTAHAEPGEETSTAFVEALYEKQARLQTTDTPREDDFQAPFARDLRRLMRAPNSATAANSTACWSTSWWKIKCGGSPTSPTIPARALPNTIAS
jgi:hypothetical protein